MAARAIAARNERSSAQYMLWKPHEAGASSAPPEPATAPPLPEVRLDARQASTYSSPPLSCRMTTRDFIEDSLYNPHYGYFSKQAHIFSPPSSIDFPAIRDNFAFMNHLSALYREVEAAGLPDTNDMARQVWHTPTELFKPWYGVAVANYLLRAHRAARTSEHEPLVIYEMGAGNGTLMLNILDHLQQVAPEVYARTRYNIIEISAQLSDIQAAKAVRGTAHHHHVAIIHRSIFDWDTVVPEPCFFIGMEDNFAHDLVRYDLETGNPVQGMVVVDADGDYEEVYEPVSDPLITRYLEDRAAVGHRSPALGHQWARTLRRILPFAPNLSPPEFLPTRLYQFLQLLHHHFPRHRLVLSDFDYLPDTVPGFQAPVVQTRYKGTMVPCPTYLVQPGYFDIFFPTDFARLQRMYAHLRGPGSGSAARVQSQRDFLLEHADLARTRTRSGENPMLNFYQNFQFFLT